MRNSVVLFFLIFLFPSPHFAQVIDWQNTIGGASSEALFSIQQTSDGGYILGGRSFSNISGDKTENNIGNEDYWIVKTDASGNIQWQNTIGGSTADYLYSIQQTSDGGYILGGASQSDISGDKTENSLGGFDFWMVKTDSLGNIQWQNTIGGNSEDFLRSIQQTSDGGYILGGYSSSDISGDKTENNMGGGGDYWIVKTDSLGAIQWQNTIGGSSDEDLTSMMQTIDGGYILGGYSNSNSSGDKTENSMGQYDYWIVKTDALGNIQWQNTIGGDNYELLLSMQQTTDGGYILGGPSYSGISGDKTENSYGEEDYWIVKTDTSGNIQWQRTIGGNEMDRLFSIKQTNDGGYILCGSSYSDISGLKTENRINESSDFWVLKINSNGNIEWQNTLGGNNEDIPKSIQQTSDGEYVIGGYSNSNISGDKTENNWDPSLNTEDYWIIHLTENYNLIKGQLFNDANNNGIKDTMENPIPNKMITEGFSSRFCFSEQDGTYSISVLDTGNFVVTSQSINYFIPTPSSQAAYFPGMHLEDSLNDFAYQSLGTFNDLCVTLTPLGMFRAGRNASYMLTYENVGTTTLNATVIFYPDTNLSFVSSAPAPTSVSLDSTTWNIGTLAPFQSGRILVTVLVDSTTPIGTLILSNARIEPIAGDANAYCNNGTWGILTTGSFDPNEILVSRNTIFTIELSNPPYLEYIINFQNTGNDTALDVSVTNPVDTNKLQISTLEMMSSSHPVSLSYKPWEKNMEFSFNNIFLPDSNVNEPASHGFVRYRIKPKSSLIAGDSILNTAYIYFDFNQPVQTNTAFTQIILPTSIDELTVSGLQFTMYPNPLTSQATVSFDNPKHEVFELSVSDMIGRLIESATTTTGEIILEKGNKTPGLYLLTLTHKKTGERANAKIVIGD